MKLKNNMSHTCLDIFFELAFLAEQKVENTKSAYAGFLYKWIELIESFQVGDNEKQMAQDVSSSLDRELQAQKVSSYLADKNPSGARNMVADVGDTALQLINETLNYDVQFNPSAFETIIYPYVDEKGNTTFKFKFPTEASPGTITGLIYYNLLSSLKLEIRRFQKCPKCGKFFYQYQRKNQKYCSRECSETGRTGRMYQIPESPI
jgi:hypothetical protein